MAGPLTRAEIDKICTLVDERRGYFEQFIETGTFHGETIRSMAS